jgi:hypothetical protein
MSPWLDWREQWFAFTRSACCCWCRRCAGCRHRHQHGHQSGAPMHDNPPSAAFLRLFMAPISVPASATWSARPSSSPSSTACPGWRVSGSWSFLAIGLRRCAGLHRVGLHRPPYRRAERPDPRRGAADRRHPAAGDGWRPGGGDRRRPALRRHLHRHGEPGADHGRALLPDAAGQDDGQDDHLLRRRADPRPGGHRLARGEPSAATPRA